MRQTKRLERRKEERLVLPDRPAQPPAELIQIQPVPRQPVYRIKVVIRRKIAVPVLLEQPAVELIRSRPRHEPDLHRAFARVVRARRRRRHRHLFNRVHPRLHRVEHPVRALQRIVLNIDPVHRDVDGGLRQPVDRRIPHRQRRLRPRLRRDQFRRVMARERQVVNLIPLQRRRHLRRVRLHNLRPARHLAGLRQRPHLLRRTAPRQRCPREQRRRPRVIRIPRRRHARVQLHIGDARRLEPRLRHRNPVSARRQTWHHPVTLVVRPGAEGLVIRRLEDLHLRARNRRALRIRYGAVQTAGGDLRGSTRASHENRQCFGRKERNETLHDRPL